MKTKPVDALMKEFNRAFENLLRQFGDRIDAQQMLAIASHAVGRLIALQDQRTMTKDMALQVVIQNIEVGNQEAIAKLTDSKGSA